MSTLDEALAEIDATIARRRDGIDLAEEAVRLAGSLRLFIRAAWPLVEPGVQYRPNWHIDAMSDHLEAVTATEIHKLMIWVPPGSMKSRAVSIFWPAWEWCTRPWLRYFSGSYEIGLAGRLTAKTRDLLITRWFQARWGHLFRMTKLDERYYANDQGGTRLATAPGSTGSGEHGHRIIIDDPLNAQQLESLTDAKLNEANAWYDGTLSTRGVGDTAEVVIMQRLHERDLAEHALEFDPSSWTILCIPEEYEPKHPYAWRGDPRTEPGELMWPEVFTPERTKMRREKLGPYRAAGQLQQRPAAREGLLLKRADWRYYDPDLSFYAQEVGKAFGPTEVAELASRIGRFDRIVHDWDTSVKDREHSDYVSGGAWGCLGADLFLLRLFHERAGLSATIDAMLWLAGWSAELWADIPQFIVIEGQANGKDAAKAIRRRVRGVIVADAQGSKELRAETAEPALTGHNCFLPGYANDTGDNYDASRTPAPVMEFVEELSGFNLAQHDDHVDMWSSTVIWTAGKGGGMVMETPKGIARPPRFHQLGRPRDTRLRPGLR